MSRFFQATLRTSDVEAARAFYTQVLGEVPLDIVELHEQAVARGARPHWLGFLEVADVDRSAAAFVERGASLLGPKWVNPQGLEAAVLRDPGGAIVALGKPLVKGPTSVVFHVLNTADVQRAKLNYGELFGWDFRASVDLGTLGVVHPFSWEAGAPPVGLMLDIGSRPGVHPHWLFQFQVPALGFAVEVVRAARGTALRPMTLSAGEQMAVCDDPQGAAFALRQRA